MHAIRLIIVFLFESFSARPPDVIYNPKPGHSSQERGSATWGWYKWTLGLTYDTMLEGIPGTGTRNNGLDGKMLRVNLDQIVLLRFHGMSSLVNTVSHHVYLPLTMLSIFVQI